MSISSSRETPDELPDSKKPPNWGMAGEVAKYTAVIAIVIFCVNIVRKKLAIFTWSQVWEGLATVPPHQIILALAITAANFFILTGYDWIAIHYLKKSLPLRKIMMGAVIGYAMSNVLGWMLGGTMVRYRLYTRWGFSWMEVIAFISILSVTFWLGMFLLAGIAFVMLPVHLPDQYQEHLYFSPMLFGYGFLTCVALYLLATLFIRRPIRLGSQNFAFPPFKLSILQLSVSAADFALASLVLYVLLPSGTANYSTVLVSYLAAMIVTVTLHIPGGFGVLELIVLELLEKEGESGSSLPLAITCGLLLFRLIYYILPGVLAALLFLQQEVVWSYGTKTQTKV
ncbi:MAG: YbhN family protein [Pirellulaceae bacterium]|nr:YbhN family protein [Pirellulaceae bacterium]